MNNTELLNKVFTQLTVLSCAGIQVNEVTNKRHRIWNCICTCGKETIATTSQLLRGGKLSCGCRKLASAKTNGLNNALGAKHSGLTVIYLSYRNRAKKIGVKFSLTRKQVEKLIQLPCTYCGSTFSNTLKKSSFEYRHNGIDRTDSGKGYSLDNTVPCCKTCNYMKLSLSVDEFLTHIRKIISFQGRED